MASMALCVSGNSPFSGRGRVFQAFQCQLWSQSSGHRWLMPYALDSAVIHYPRATLEMCPDLIAKSKEGGVEVIQTYDLQPWSVSILPDCRNIVFNTAKIILCKK